jgi:beta-1,4-mannosyl-glycoprotein beta-1,4-N-acetylglucosaminyltransferase
MKIIDCFIFYNELDMLNYRFNILNDVVDYFILVESNYTFNGEKKELFFYNNRHLFDKFNDKIIHIVVDKVSNTDAWSNEYNQRNSIDLGIKQIDMNDDDIIIISDVDEIIDPNTLSKILNDSEYVVDIKSLEMDCYYYNLNSKIVGKWKLSKILTFRKYKELNLSCDKIRNYNCSIIPKSGWHLSYFGDAQFISNKIKNFSHQEYNNEYFTNIEKIDKHIIEASDLYNRDNNQIVKISIADNNYLPTGYDKFLKQWILY